MLKYYIKLAIRKFQSNRLIFAGSIVTISLGAICISLLSSYVYNELAMDDFHQRKNIYMTILRQTPESSPEAIDVGLFFNLNYKDYPELVNQVSVTKYPKGEMAVSSGISVFTPEILVVDSTFFKVFDFKLSLGNKDILRDPGSAVITEDFARVLFGNKDPIGQEIKVINSNITYTIKGIAENIRSNSSISFDLIIPIHSASDRNTYSRMGAGFLLVNDKFNPKDFNEKINHLVENNPFFKESRLSIISLKDIYFTKDISNSSFGIFTGHGDNKNIKVLIVIILVILIITILNFAGLQVIMLNSGIKNIGLGKILGLRSMGFISQKGVELMAYIVISSFIVSISYFVILPYFNNYTDGHLNPSLWIIVLINIAVITLMFIIAMIYPAIINSNISITNSLKGKLSSRNFISSQKIIVSVQYALTIILIISSIVIFRQVSLMLNKNPGFDSQNVIKVKMFKRKSIYDISMEERQKNKEQQLKSYQYVLNELSTNPYIEYFSQGDSPLDSYDMSWKLKSSEKDYQTQSILTVNPRYLKLLDLKLKEGRFFDEKIDLSRGNKVVINEAAKKYWEIKDIGTNRMLNKSWEDSLGYEIIGVVEDFNYQHLSVKPKPLFILYFEDADMNFLIKLKSGTIQPGLDFVSKLFKEVNPGEDFNYSFLSDDIASLYIKEKRLSQIYFIFTLIAILITTIGLVIIAIYDAQRRTKEIGVRKVTGAKTGEIITMLNIDFIKIVLIAYIIACPIAWIAMHKWLQNFAYKTELSWWVFALAGSIAVIIALFTISWQSLRAATRNPVEALRYE